MASLDSRRAHGSLAAARDVADQADQRPWHGEADGPRRPEELLDQLRQRLDRLAANHPSAGAPEPERAGTAGTAGPRSRGGGDEHRPADHHEHDHDHHQHDDHHQYEHDHRQHDDDNKSDDDTGHASRRTDAETDAEGGRRDHESLDGFADAGPGAPTEAGGRLAEPAEECRPWFLSPEEGVPWFAAERGSPASQAPGPAASDGGGRSAY